MKPGDYVFWISNSGTAVARIVVFQAFQRRAFVEIDGRAGMRLWVPLHGLRVMPEVVKLADVQWVAS